jgi:hypothetical protein
MLSLAPTLRLVGVAAYDPQTGLPAFLHRIAALALLDRTVPRRHLWPLLSSLLAETAERHQRYLTGYSVDGYTQMLVPDGPTDLRLATLEVATAAETSRGLTFFSGLHGVWSGDAFPPSGAPGPSRGGCDTYSGGGSNDTLGACGGGGNSASSPGLGKSVGKGVGKGADAANSAGPASQGSKANLVTSAATYTLNLGGRSSVTFDRPKVDAELVALGLTPATTSIGYLLAPSPLHDVRTQYANTSCPPAFLRAPAGWFTEDGLSSRAKECITSHTGNLPKYFR